MPGSPCKAIIVDNNFARGSGIRQALEALGCRSVVHLLELKVKSYSLGCTHDNFDMDNEFDAMDMLFIHLGRAEQGAAPRRGGGNRCSMELLQACHARLRRVCVIAYSGGNDPAPGEFTTFADPAWHAYFDGVSTAKALNIAALVIAWRRDPASPPPLACLKKRPEAPMVRMLLDGVADGDVECVVLLKTRLGTPDLYRQLLDELAGPGDDEREMAGDVRAFLAEHVSQALGRFETDLQEARATWSC